MINKIFIACPISKYINGKEFTNNDFKLFIEKLYTLCQEFVPNVFLALRREEFGKKLMTDICTVLDFNEISSSDWIIAIPEDSMGVAVELGWAMVLKKRTILLLDKSQRYTPLISGMGDITDTTVIFYDHVLNDKVLKDIREFMLTNL